MMKHRWATSSLKRSPVLSSFWVWRGGAPVRSCRDLHRLLWSFSPRRWRRRRWQRNRAGWFLHHPFLLFCFFHMWVTTCFCPTARNDDHGRSDGVILVQVTGDVQITILRVSVSKQPGLPRRFETLSERESVLVVAIPASKSRYMPSPKLIH